MGVGRTFAVDHDGCVGADIGIGRADRGCTGDGIKIKCTAAVLVDRPCIDTGLHLHSHPPGAVVIVGDCLLAAGQHLTDFAVCLIAGSRVPVENNIAVNRDAQLADDRIAGVGSAADRFPRYGGLVFVPVLLACPF